MPTPTLQDLQAFAPSGSLIVSTLECSIGTMPVASFRRDLDEAFRHDFRVGQGWDDGDPETVSIAGDVVYVDDDGAYWPEPALTYQTADGKVVRAGIDMPALKVPDIDRAFTLAVRAESLSPSRRRQLSEADWEVTCTDQGWNDSSRATHLLAFIRPRDGPSRRARRVRPARRGRRERGARPGPASTRLIATDPELPS
jgi:hypothetical protein